MPLYGSVGGRRLIPGALEQGGECFSNPRGGPRTPAGPTGRHGAFLGCKSFYSRELWMPYGPLLVVPTDHLPRMG